MASINLGNIKRKRRKLNLGLLGEKQICYLCAKQPPPVQQLFNFAFTTTISSDGKSNKEKRQSREHCGVLIRLSSQQKTLRGQESFLRDSVKQSGRGKSRYLHQILSFTPVDKLVSVTKFLASLTCSLVSSLGFLETNNCNR